MEKGVFKFAKELDILYVEDDYDSREKIKEVLNIFFRSVDIAKDGEEGLEKFKEKEFDIVFTDIYMPKMNGLELVKKIKDISPATRCVIITAYSDSNFVLEAISLNVDGFLLKPISLDSLKGVLDKVVKCVYYEKVLECKKVLALNECVRDEITGLFNTFELKKHLSAEKSLVLIDIRDFKTVNLVYGYDSGDIVLKEFATFLKENVEDEVYKLEADKFAILTLKNKEEIKKMVNNIFNKLSHREYFLVNDKKIYIDINVSIAYRSEDLLKKARVAMDEIKLHKKGNINFYS